MPPRKILEISTLAPDRLAIEIDGKLYELKDRGEMGIEDLVVLQALYRDVEGMQNMPAEAVTGEVAVSLAHAMDKLTRLLLINCPTEIHMKLKDHHRLAIFTAFQEAAGDVITEETQPQTEEPKMIST